MAILSDSEYHFSSTYNYWPCICPGYRVRSCGKARSTVKLSAMYLTLILYRPAAQLPEVILALQVPLQTRCSMAFPNGKPLDTSFLRSLEATSLAFSSMSCGVLSLKCALLHRRSH
jgi:hypothetical protein